MSEKFDFEKMRNLYECGVRKDDLDCKEYIIKFFKPLINGTHALIEDDQVTIIQKDTMKDVFLSRFPKTIQVWYKTMTTPVQLICDINKPITGDGFVNISKKVKHIIKPYESNDDVVKKGVQTMLDFIKEVWANNVDSSFQYIIKWLSNMVKGKRNCTCLYVKALQGVGKSTLPEFIRDYVIGKDITCKGKTDHLKGQHNLQLLGRLFVYFEELQIFSEKEWSAVDSELKDMITDNWGSYTDKYEKRFEAENINNYMVLTNSNLKGINGRRYFVVDISPTRMDDFEYYGNLRKQCYNDEVGQAFYNYLMEFNTDGFMSLEMPLTESKMIAVSELLTPLEKFLKLNFLLRNTGINEKLKTLHELYKRFDDGKYAMTSIQKFSSNMRELGFKYKPMNGYNTYNITFDELQKMATKRKWLSDLDNDTITDNNKKCEDSDALDEGVNKTDQSMYQLTFLKNENDELKKQIELLQAQLKKDKPKEDKPNEDRPKKKVKKEKPKTPTEEFRDVVGDIMEII